MSGIEPTWNAFAVEVYARWVAESELRAREGPPWTWTVHPCGRGGFGRRWLRGLAGVERGPRAAGAWVDEVTGVPRHLLAARRVEVLPVGDAGEAARSLARPRDLVDECVAVTLREPTWL